MQTNIYIEYKHLSIMLAIKKLINCLNAIKIDKNNKKLKKILQNTW